MSNSEEGVVKDGKWNRGKGEIVRKVELKEMKNAFQQLGNLFSSAAEKYITVPLGSICAISEGGRIVDILPPGKQTTVKWFEAFVEQLRENDISADFYLISKQPIPFVVKTTAATSNKETQMQTFITGQMAHVLTDFSALEQFLQKFVGDKRSLSIEDVQKSLRVEVEQAIGNQTASLAGTSLKQLAQCSSSIERELNGKLSQSTGLSFAAQVSLQGVTQSCQIHLGLVDVPDTTPCQSCKQPYKRGSRFCTSCAFLQIRHPKVSKKGKGEERPLITKDGKHIEIDIAVQFFTPSGNVELSEYTNALADSFANSIREKEWSSFGNSAGMQTLESQGSTITNGLVGSSRVNRFTILDMRTKEGEWMLNMEADMNQIRREIDATKQWLGVQEEEMETESLVQQLIASRAQSQREKDLQSWRAKEAIKLKRKEAEAEYNAQSEVLILTAAEQTFALEEQRAALRMKKSDLAANEQQNEMEINDRIQRIETEQVAKRRLDSFLLSAAFSAEKRSIERGEESKELEHNQSLSESKSKFQRSESLVNSDFKRTESLANAENAAKIKELQADLDLRIRKNIDLYEVELEKQQLEVESLRQEINMEGLVNEQKLAEEVALNAHKRELEKIRERYKREKEEEDAARQLAKDKYIHAENLEDKKNTQEQLMADKAREKENEKYKFLEGMDKDRMLAYAFLRGTPLTDAEAQALGKILNDTDKMSEMYEKLLTQQTEHTENLKQILTESVLTMVKDQVQSSVKEADEK